MHAPTHITGPDGTLCRRGEEIPADWFDELLDLADHLNEIGEADDEVPADGDPVKATATVRRRRQSGPDA